MSLHEIERLARAIPCQCYDVEAMEFDPRGKCEACRILDEVEALIEPPIGITRHWLVKCPKCSLTRWNRSYAEAARLLNDHACPGDEPLIDKKPKRKGSR